MFWSVLVPASRRRRRRLIGTILRLLCAAVVVTASLVIVLRWFPPPTSAFMLRAQFFSSNGIRDIDYQWVDWVHMSSHVAVAVIAAEDQKFPHHWGFDFDQIRNAFEENKRRRLPRGASTISQQVAKNMFLWSGRSYVRKALEGYFTILIELFWSKRRILEIYLNVVEFAPGVYGVRAAAQRFFGKSPSDLGLYEAALMAAVLPNPRLFRLDRPTRYVQERTAHIRQQMGRLGGVQYLKSIGERKRKHDHRKSNP